MHATLFFDSSVHESRVLTLCAICNTIAILRLRGCIIYAFVRLRGCITQSRDWHAILRLRNYVTQSQDCQDWWNIV